MNPKSYGLGVPTSSTLSVNLVGNPSRLSPSHGRTDGLTKKNSPRSVDSRNASSAGGQPGSLADVVKHALDCADCRARLFASLLQSLIVGGAA